MSVRSMQARVNPVYLTAKTAVCWMEQAGIPGADKIVQALHLEKHAPLQNMTDAETILGNALVFALQYTLEKGMLRLSLRGRLDTISAPQLLRVWEKAKDGGSIEGVRIDCTHLEYISSAGIRLLQAIQENCSRPIVFSGAKAKVKEILRQT